MISLVVFVGCGDVGDGDGLGDVDKRGGRRSCFKHNDTGGEVV